MRSNQRRAFRRSLCAGIALLVSTVAPLVAQQAETSTPATAATDRADDPLYALCSKWGRPVTADELQDFGSYTIVGIADGTETYREVIGPFENDRTRSVRYQADVSRSAHIVEIRDRQLCFDIPNRTESLCAVPIVCSSGEADFFVLDASDSAVARIEMPDPDAPPPENGHDWVTFAGGTARIAIADETALERSRASRTPTDLGNCRIGSGHPDIDAAMAYQWTSGQCANRAATGAGEVHFLSQNGQIGAVPLGAGRGLETRNGQLYWSFPDKPIDMRVTCSTAEDSIPLQSRDVASVEARLVAPSGIALGESLVLDKIAMEAMAVASEICGKDAEDADLTIKVMQPDGPGDAPKEMVTRHLKPGAKVTTDLAPALRNRIRQADQAATRNSLNDFARFVRARAETERGERMSRAIDDARLPNVSNGLREFEIRTLLALTGGVETRIPWYRPSFRDGDFIVSWTITSTDPLDDFLRPPRDSEEWTRLRSLVPKQEKTVRLDASCLISPRDGQKFQPDSFVYATAKLISFSQSTIVMRCSAP